MSRRGCNILLAYISLLVGGTLYACFRSTTYIAIALRSIPGIATLSQKAAVISCDFLSYYFPDFLWAFSLCCALNAIHLPGRCITLLCGIGTVALGVLWEVLQYTHIVSGTGDLWDIFVYFLAALLATIINLGGRKHEKI